MASKLEALLLATPSYQFDTMLTRLQGAQPQQSKENFDSLKQFYQESRQFNQPCGGTAIPNKSHAVALKDANTWATSVQSFLSDKFGFKLSIPLTQEPAAIYAAVETQLSELVAKHASGV